MKKTAPKPFIFVLMPFDETLTDLYELGIKAACQSIGTYCERVDEQFFQESILDRIYNQIAKADIVLCVMTGRNPNVFYGTGYAHALDKTTILITNRVEDIPFDLNDFSHIVYGESISEMKTVLEKRLEWLLDHRQEGRVATAREMQFYIRGDHLTNKEYTIPFPVSQYKAPQTIPFGVEVWNITSRTIGGEKHQFALVTQQQFGKMPVKLPDGKFMYPLAGLKKVFPSGWGTVSTDLALDHIEMTNDLSPSIAMVLRVFTETAVIDYPFSVRIKLTQ